MADSIPALSELDHFVHNVDKMPIGDAIEHAQNKLFEASVDYKECTQYAEASMVAYLKVQNAMRDNSDAILLLAGTDTPIRSPVTVTEGLYEMKRLASECTRRAVDAIDRLDELTCASRDLSFWLTTLAKLRERVRLSITVDCDTDSERESDNDSDDEPCAAPACSYYESVQRGMAAHAEMMKKMTPSATVS